MSCGAKPTGHKKFCRHCAVALNPEQVICVKCGAGIGSENLATTLMAGVKRAIPPDAAASLITGVKRIVPPNVVTFIPEKIKKLPKPAIIAGIAIIAGMFLLFVIGSVTTAPRFTPAEQAEVDKLLAEHGRDAIIRYMTTVNRRTDENRILRYLEYFVSQGADVNARHMGATPLDMAEVFEFTAVTEYLTSVGARERSR